MTISISHLQEKPFPSLKETVPQIRIASISEQEPIIANMVLAFSADPAMRWMYPDPYQYLTYFPQFVKAFAGKAFDRGTAFYCEGYAGAALWFPPGLEPDAEPLIELLQKTVVETEQADIFAVFEQMGDYHPHQPHWYLPLIGVEPIQQRKGYGSALMQYVLQQCDGDRIPAYLEASKPANVPFYERHGFDLLGTIQVGASPPIFPMMRQPQ